MIAPQEERKRLLILKPSALGDIIHTLPLLASLRESFPSLQIWWAVKSKFAELLKTHPYLNGTIVWEKRRFWQFLKKIRRKRFHIVLELQGLFRTGFIVYLSGAKERWGFSKEETKECQFFFLTRTVKTKNSHIVEKNLEMAEELGAKKKVEFLIPENEEAKMSIEKYLKKSGVSPKDKLIALIPGGGWGNKIWSEKKFASLGKELTLRKDWRIIIIWGPGEFKKADLINRMAEGKLLLGPSTTISQLVSLLKRCSMAIGGDTGPLHLAVALDIPVIGLYGPTPPSRNGPFGEKKEIIYHALPCSPCWRRNCKRKECMNSIGVEEVIERCKSLASRFF